MGDLEQMNYGQLAMGLEQPSLFMMRAPAPVKLLASTHDFFQIDAVWESFRWIKRHYTDLGFSERADILENNEGHNYDRTQREAVVRWMNQWLNGKVEAINEPELNLFSEEELWATPSGQVLDLKGVKSIFDLFKDKLESIRPDRDGRWNKMSTSEKRDVVRSAIQVRTVEKVPNPKVHDLGSIAREDYTIRKKLLETEEGLYLPLLDLSPSKFNNDTPLVFVSSKGASASLIENDLMDLAAKSGRRVIAVDPRGVGETEQKSQISQGSFFGTDQEDVTAAYVLGESYLGMRVEDILRAVRYAIGNASPVVDLFAEGQIGVAALHAAFLEPGLISHVQLKNSIESWESILDKRRSYHQLANVVHGCLLHYDLSHLENELEDHLEIILPVDSLGFENIPEGAPVPPGYYEPNKPGLVGTFFSSSSFFSPQGEYLLDALSIDYDNAVEKQGNDWSAIWSGFLIGPVTGTVTIRADTGQNLSFIIDGDLLMELGDFPGTKTVTVEMEKGGVYLVELRYQLPSGGKGNFNIEWSWEGKSFALISHDSLRYSAAHQSEIRKTWR